MKKILHIITGLSDGGAEAVLYRLSNHDKKNQHIVVSLMDQGKYGPLLEEIGVQVYCLDMPAGKVRFAALIKLYKLIRQLKPDVVQTWMYHADLIGGVMARVAGMKNVFWNIRHTTLEPGKSKKSTILIAKLCAYLSAFIPKGIVCCAQEAVRVHSELGYKASKMIVIGNGYDLEFFNPNYDLMVKFRNELNVESGTVLLGMVGRFDPQKDHFGLLAALSAVKSSISDFKFSLIGRDLNSTNTALNNEIKKLDLQSNLLLLDQRNDIASVMNGLDIHVLSSAFGEAFPNVLAEAMACGTPCITTDVGDAAVIVGDTGWVVPPKDPQVLAKAMSEAMEEKQSNPQAWQTRKQACRERIVNNFSINKMVEGYHQVWFN
ncbi:glycosyltransferase family 4 protein [Vibrio metschnikovii]|uniref:glycosyltransferase family 4 protein n=1 Tax=Vibrio metschnikovii TaxID=28172 RepID=UPI001C304428|nr:glycosyltransferase [Vibrio metschnikovii]EKO3566828.1 glycosyltransferase [Vibrio metschnikovii]EKO3770668.1 glycosyltransferase [Vibrio metschnikovii]